MFPDNNRSLISAVFVLALLYCFQADAFEIRNRISQRKLTVGDKFLYTSSVSDTGGARIQPIIPGEKLGDAYVISGIYRLKSTGENEISYACTLAVYNTGKVWIPSPDYIITDSSGAVSQASGDSLELEITSVLPSDSSSLEIADIRGPRKIPISLWPYLIILILLGLLIFSFLYIKRKFKRNQIGPIINPEPPWEVAFRKLDELKGKRHVDFGRLSLFYFELSLIIREYIESLFGVPAMENTTYELELTLQSISLARDEYDHLFSLFNRADLAKFARTIPSAKDANADIDYAYEFIRLTRPQVMEQTGKPQEQEIKAV